MTSTDTSALPTRSIQIYLLAADADRLVCEAIVKHLKPVVREFAVPVQLFNDFDVPLGSEPQAHKQRLLRSDIVLALISADFISDDEIYSRVKAVTELHNSGKLVMIPLLVRNCLWKATPFARLGMLPKNFQPLNNLQFWPSTDDALMAVVSDVYGALGLLSQNAATMAEAASPARPLAATNVPAVTAAAADAEAGAGAGAAAPGARPPAAGQDWRRVYYRNVLWRRAAALAIDWGVAIVLLFVWLVINLLIHPDANQETLDASAAVAVMVIFYLLCPLLEASAWQATVGKRMMGLQITDRDGRRIGFGRAFVRTVVRSFVMYAYIFLIPALVQVMRFRTTKKLFHDELSSTLIGERVRPQAAMPTAAASAA